MVTVAELVMSYQKPSQDRQLSESLADITGQARAGFASGQAEAKAERDYVRALGKSVVDRYLNEGNVAMTGGQPASAQDLMGAISSGDFNDMRFEKPAMEMQEVPTVMLYDRKTGAQRVLATAQVPMGKSVKPTVIDQGTGGVMTFDADGNLVLESERPGMKTWVRAQEKTSGSGGGAREVDLAKWWKEAGMASNPGGAFDRKFGAEPSITNIDSEADLNAFGSFQKARIEKYGRLAGYKAGQADNRISVASAQAKQTDGLVSAFADLRALLRMPATAPMSQVAKVLTTNGYIDSQGNRRVYTTAQIVDKLLMVAPDVGESNVRAILGIK